MLDNYILDKALLLEDEIKELIYTLQSMDTIKVFNESDALEKLSALFKIQSESWFKTILVGGEIVVIMISLIN